MTILAKLKCNEILIQALFFVCLILAGFISIDVALPWLLLIASTFSFRSVFIRQFWKNYTFSGLMLVYLVWLFIVVCFSQVPNNSRLVFVILAGFPVMFLIASNMLNFEKLWSVLRVVIFTLGVVFGVWAIWQVYYHIGRGEAIGPLVDRNAFAALINLLWFPTLYLFTAKKYQEFSWVRWGIGLGMFIMSIALFATTSRGGIATWLLLIPIALWATYQHTKSINSVLTILVIIVSAYLSSVFLLDSNIANRTFALSQDNSTGARLIMWQSSVKMAFDYPLFGTGWGTWGSFYPAYRPEIEKTTAGFFAHNDYLQFAVEGGLLAMILLLSMLLSALVLLRRSFNKASELVGLESITLLLGILAVYIHAGLNFIFYFAFINIVSGLYFARIVQLVDFPRVIKIPKFEQVRTPIKRLIGGLIVLFIAAPFALKQIAVGSYFGNQPVLKAINKIAPTVTVFDVASLIAAIHPTEHYSQDALLQISEQYLAQSLELGLQEEVKRNLLNEAIARYDKVRAQSANDPKVGLREINMLMTYHSLLNKNVAYDKAYQVIKDNLKANPYHAKSMIALSRLELAQGYKEKALSTLAKMGRTVLTRRDQQLIMVEYIRQTAAPKVIVELDEIEKQLNGLLNDAEAGYQVVLKDNYYEDIDARLDNIANTINK